MTVDQIKFEDMWIWLDAGELCKIQGFFQAKDGTAAILVDDMGGMGYYYTNKYELIPLDLELFLENFEPILEV